MTWGQETTNFKFIYLSPISGKGSAYFTDFECVISKVILYARGKEDYKNTSFTKNMDEEKH